MKKEGLLVALLSLILFLIVIKIISADWTYTDLNGDLKITTDYYNATVSNSTGLVSFYDPSGNYLTDFGGVEIINASRKTERNFDFQPILTATISGNTSYVLVRFNGTYANYSTNYTFNRSSGKLLINQTITYNRKFDTDIERIFNYYPNSIYSTGFEGDVIYEDTKNQTSTTGSTTFQNANITKVLNFTYYNDRDFNWTTDRINSVNVSVWMTETTASGNFTIYVNNNKVVTENCTDRYDNASDKSYHKYLWQTYNFSVSYLNNKSNNVTIVSAGNCLFYIINDSVQRGYSYNKTGGLFGGEYFIRFLLNGENEINSGWDVVSTSAGGSLNLTNTLSRYGNNSLRWDIANGSAIGQIRNKRASDDGNLNFSILNGDYDSISMWVYTNYSNVKFAIVGQYGSYTFYPGYVLAPYLPQNQWVQLHWNVQKTNNVSAYNISYYNLYAYNDNKDNITIYIDDIKLYKSYINQTYIWSQYYGRYIAENYSNDSTDTSLNYNQMSMAFTFLNSTTQLSVYGNDKGASGINELQSSYEMSYPSNNSDPTGSSAASSSLDKSTTPFWTGSSTYKIHNSLFEADMFIWPYNGYLNIDTNKSYYTENATGGSISSATLVLEFKPIQNITVGKRRLPRMYGASYSLIDDTDSSFIDRLLAVYYGTSNISSPDYGNKGLVGHKLYMTKTIWVNNTQMGLDSADNATLKAIVDDLYSRGVKIALHTVGESDDNRTTTAAGIQYAQNNYNVLNWVDHDGNADLLGRQGSNISNTLYYNLDLIENSSIKYAWDINTCPVYLQGQSCTDSFLCMPHKSSYLYDPAGANQIYLYGRDNIAFFNKSGSELWIRYNSTALDDMINRQGINAIYIHTGTGDSTNSTSLLNSVFWDNSSISNVTIIKPFADAYFGMVENKSITGDLWVAPIEDVWDYVIAWDNVKMEDESESGNIQTVTYKNYNSMPVTGGTLEIYDNNALKENISQAMIGSLYEIYIKDNKVTLPQFAAGESKTIILTGGTSYNSSFPQLVYVDRYVDVIKAEYNPSSANIDMIFNGTGANKLISVIYDNPNFAAYDNGVLFANVSSGALVSSTSNYIVSYSSKYFNFTLPAMSQHEIILQQYTPASSAETSIAENPLFIPTQQQLLSEQGYEVILQKNWRVQINVGNETHRLNVDNINDNLATFTLSSNPVTFNISINETKKINFDGDNYYDLSIFLKKINGVNADIVLKIIHEEIPAGQTTETNQEFLGLKITNSMWFYAALIFVAIIIGVLYFLRMKFFRKKRKKIQG